MDAPVVVVPARRAFFATVVVAAAIATVVFGGFVVGGALSRTVGAPVEVAGVIRVQPLSGWEVASRSQSPPRVRLTRGGGNLDIAEFPFQGSAQELVAAYVRDVLEPEAQRLSVSRETQTVTLGSGLVGVRLGYVGLFGRSPAPIEGEVTAVVSPDGIGVVFDGWGAEGVLRYMLDDAHVMIGSAVIV
jgi:hypothetical protein